MGKAEIIVVIFNIKNFSEFYRRRPIAVSVLGKNYEVIWLIETWLTDAVPNETLFCIEISCLTDNDSLL